MIEEQTIAAGAKAIIDQAVKNKISDIHIEPLPSVVTVRFRHGGQLYVANKLPKSAGEQLAIHFKKLTDLDDQKTSAPQAGMCEIKSGRRKFSLEVTTMPVVDGEKITLHLVEQSAKLPELAELGLWGKGLSAANHAMAQPGGLVLVAGLQQNNVGLTLGCLLQTLEVGRPDAAYIGSNYALPDYVQRFAFGTSSVPDSRRLKMLGKRGVEVFGVEIFKDKSTAEIALELAASKKLVLAGSVAPDITSAINGLKFVGQNHLLAANLRLAIGQAFARQLCQHCREAYEPSPFEHKQLDEFFGGGKTGYIQQVHQLEKAAAGSNSDLGSSEKSINRLWRPRVGGCKQCGHLGYSGIIGIFEVCEPGDSLRSQIAAGRSAKTLQETAIQEGMVSLSVDGLVKALLGLIDLPTLLSVTLSAGKW